MPITRICIWLAFVYFWHVNLWKTAISTPNITSVCGPTLPFLLLADAWCTGITHVNINHFKLLLVVVYILLTLVSFISFSFFLTWCLIMSTSFLCNISFIYAIPSDIFLRILATWKTLMRKYFVMFWQWFFSYIVLWDEVEYTWISHMIFLIALISHQDTKYFHYLCHFVAVANSPFCII